MNLWRACIVAFCTGSAAVRAAEPPDFVRDVRPIFERHCYECHGERKQKSGYRLDIKATALRGGDNYGESIVPHRARDSELLRLVSSGDRSERMPPQGLGLSAAEIAVLTRWIDAGAVWPDGVDRAQLEDKRDHWSFKPVAVSPGEHSIDEFISAKLRDAGLDLSIAAEPTIWLRRVTFDLTGLPPTPEDVVQFQAEVAESATPEHIEQAHARIVSRLLSSERYGERWAQHWLDVVRYADTHGFEVNTERPHAWPYRDYVIRAFNQDTPYDRFIREQIVGDALGEDSATGFLITASVLLPGQIGKDAPSIRLARQDALDEIVNNIGQTFLGLSIGCARCHDHKFDPVTAQDYYAMQAFVAGVEYADRELRTLDAEARKQAAIPLREELQSLSARLAALPPDDAREAERLSKAKGELEAQIKAAETGPLAFAGRFRQPDDIHVLSRGDPEQPQQSVAAAVPVALGEVRLSHDAAEQNRRQALADWIASPRNPLTARVMVNRIWQGHFGRGLVATPSDFGRNGLKPSHPELLDWLAAEFVRSGWSVKHMHRLIVLSRTYRQSSQYRADAAEQDSDVRLLWRYPSRRLEAEAIRDTMLAVSGQLNPLMYGRGFDLFDKRGGLTGFKPVEQLSAETRRRMIYSHKVRRESEAVFGAFDCPDAGQSTAVRRASTTPLQALNLWNSRFTIDVSAAFAKRIPHDAGSETQSQVQHAYQWALSRKATDDELQDAVSIANAHGLSAVCRALFNSHEFLMLP